MAHPLAGRLLIFLLPFQAVAKKAPTASTVRASNRRSYRRPTMRFMIMHKNDPNTEAGMPPPLELVHKMGALIGEYLQTGRFIDGAGLGASKTRTRLTFRNGECTDEARSLSRRARAAGRDVAAEGPHARGGDRLGRALRQDPRRRRAGDRQGERTVGHRRGAGAGESAAADAADREGRRGHRGRRPEPAAEGRDLSPQDRDDQGGRAASARCGCRRAPRASASRSPTTTCGSSTARSSSRRS